VRAGGVPQRPQGNGAARARGPVPDYDNGQSFQPGPGYPTAPPTQEYNNGQGLQPAPAYPTAPPTQEYNTGQSFGAPQDYNNGQQFQPAPGYPTAPPVQDYSTGQGFGPASGVQPVPGYPQAQGFTRSPVAPPRFQPDGGRGPRPGSPQGGGPQGGRGNRRLYAVPSTSGPEHMDSGGGQMVQYAGGQALALAEPAWEDDPQDDLASMPAAVIAPPRPRTRPNAPAGRPARTAPARSPRPASLARPTGPRTAPATKQGGARGRQARAMRIATAATVSLFSISVIAAGANIAHFGFKFFTFRETGAGETGPNGGSDQDFLAQKAAAAKAAAQGHTPGKHSATTTSG
jgi:hypothetical protein